MVRTPQNETSILSQGLTKEKIGVGPFNEASVKGRVDEWFYVMGPSNASIHSFNASFTNLVVVQDNVP